MPSPRHARSAALHVETEAPGAVAARPRLGVLGEETADRVVDAGVGGGVRARRAADRGLVDDHDLVHLLRPRERPERPRPLRRAVEPPLERRAQGVVHERALPRAGDPGDRAEEAERDADVDILEVVVRRPGEEERAPRLRGAPRLREFDAPAPGEVLPGERRGGGGDLRDRPLRDHRPPVDARAGAEVHDVIRGADGRLVVLDDDDRIAEVAEAGEGLEEARRVAGVEGDARLVEDVEHPGEPRPDLRREPRALRLAGERVPLSRSSVR